MFHGLGFRVYDYSFAIDVVAEALEWMIISGMLPLCLRESVSKTSKH